MQAPEHLPLPINGVQVLATEGGTAAVPRPVTLHEALSARAAAQSVTYRHWAEALIHVSIDDKCLKLPTEVTKGIKPAALRSDLYIRNCYEPLCQLLFDKAERAIAAGQPPAFILTGTPGIGKSAMALLLIRLLGLRKKLVYYEYKPRGTDVVRLKLDFRGEAVKASVWHEQWQVDDDDEDYNDPTCWLIVEGQPPAAEFDGDRITVVLAPPDHANFSKFRKGRGCQEPTYMPVCSLQEILECRDRLRDTAEVSYEAALERYKWFGGSIRDVLFKTHSPEEAVTAMMPSLRYTDTEQLVRTLVNPSSYRDERSYSLAHIMVTRSFKMRYVSFASPKISALILDKLVAQQKTTLRSFSVAPDDMPLMAALRGMLFEQYGHKVCLQGGAVWRWRQLEPSRKRSHPAAFGVSDSGEAYEQQQQQQQWEEADGEQLLDMEVEQSHHFSRVSDEPRGQQVHHERQQQFKLKQQQEQDYQQQLQQQQQEVGQQQKNQCARGPGQQLHQAAADEHSCKLPSGLQHLWDSPDLRLEVLSNTYLQPPSSNNAAWDAVIFSDKILILQYTNSSRHGIEAKPIQKLLKRLRPDRSKQAQLVFVVPQGMYDSFPWQPWQTASGGTLLHPGKQLEALEQYVMELDPANTMQ